MTVLTCRRNVLVVILVVLMVSVAGCSGLADSLESRSTFDVNEPGPTNHSAAANGAGIVFDEDQDRAPSPELLVEATQAALSNQSHTVVVTRRLEAVNGSPVRVQRERTRVGRNESRFVISRYVRSTDTDEPPVQELYSNGTHVWLYLQSNDSSSTELLTRNGDPRRPDRMLDPYQGSQIRQSFYVAAEPSVTRLAESPPGIDEPVYRLTANESSGQTGSKGNMSLTVLVTETGRILNITQSYTFRTDDGRTMQWSISLSYVDVGTTTVEPPGWYGNVSNSTVNGATGRGR